VGRAGAEAPHEVGVDGAGGELTLRGAGARSGDVVEDPCELGGGEVGVEDEAGAAADRGFVAVGLEGLADAGGAAVLPDEGAVQGGAGAAVPDEAGLALVGDADRGDAGGRDAAAAQDLGDRGEHGLPQLLGVVLDPAGLREVLRELLGGAGADLEVGVDEQAGGAGGALVDGEDEVGRHAARRYHAGVRAFAGRLAAVEEGACRGDRVADHGDFGDAVATGCGANEVVW
jgi:hypothetical protein